MSTAQWWLGGAALGFPYKYSDSFEFASKNPNISLAAC